MGIHVLCPNAGSKALDEYNPGTGKVHMDHVHCRGSEQALILCDYEDPNCPHTQDALVSCERELLCQLCSI